MQRTRSPFQPSPTAFKELWLRQPHTMTVWSVLWVRLLDSPLPASSEKKQNMWRQMDKKLAHWQQWTNYLIWSVILGHIQELNERIQSSLQNMKASLQASATTKVNCIFILKEEEKLLVTMVWSSSIIWQLIISQDATKTDHFRKYIASPLILKSCRKLHSTPTLKWWNRMDEEQTKEMPIVIAERTTEVAVANMVVPTSTTKTIMVAKPVTKREVQDKVLLSTMVWKANKSTISLVKMQSFVWEITFQRIVKIRDSVSTVFHLWKMYFFQLPIQAWNFRECEL